MYSSLRIKLSIAAAASILSLVACGGGSDSAAGPASQLVDGQNGSVDPRTVDMGSEGCDLDSFAPAMLAAVNAARAIPRSCGGTAYSAAKAIGWNRLLSDAAAFHAGDMASSNAISATTTDGRALTDFVGATNYEYQAVGENVAKGYPSIGKLMPALLASPDHCQKIMSPSVTEMGAACVQSTTGTSYWSQIFAVNK